MKDNTQVMRPEAPPLPVTVTDLIAQRKVLRTRSLNDDVEECHLKLWEIESYRSLFIPIWKEDAVEGSFIADDIMAAIHVREYAEENRLPLAASSKLAAIVRSLNIVCRRYQMDRRHRQGLVNGRPARQDDGDGAADGDSLRRTA